MVVKTLSCQFKGSIYKAGGKKFIEPIKNIE